MEQVICDFCWEPKWARTFHTTLNTQPKWHACSVCAAFIDAENWNALLLRALDKHSEKHPDLPRRVIADNVRHIVDLFREHKAKQ